MTVENLLQIKNLKVTFETEKGSITAVDDVSFDVNYGETLGIVGESGSGKSVTAESILRLHNEKSTAYEGVINYEGVDLLKLSTKKMFRIRGNDISMIFQDAMTSLNPVFTIGNQIMESIVIHQKLNKKQAYSKSLEMLELIGIPSPERRMKEYPHEISGGMRQRIMIAIALACKPNLLIADEPTTALDVTIQAQILELINNLKQELNMGVIMITHDLGVVAEVCSRVAVMYLGQVVEEAEVEALFENPLHPYTMGLLKSIPKIDGERKTKLSTIGGTVPALNEVPQGCRFATRCAYATEQCLKEEPILEDVPNENRKVRCWNYMDIQKGKVV